MSYPLVINLALLFIFLSSFTAHAQILNPSFTDNLNNWNFEGNVTTNSEEAVITDGSPINSLHQGTNLLNSTYTLSFDFFSNISTFIPQNAFADTFFASVYFIDDINSFNANSGQFNNSLELFDFDIYGANIHNGFLHTSDKGPEWFRFQLEFTLNNNFIIPYFELLNLNNQQNDSSVRIDNVQISLSSNDQCPNNPNKTEPGVCGCLVADEDKNNNGIIDCLEECIGICDPNNPDLDEDGDGIPNCIEIEDGTNPCDSGSFTPKLKPSACAGANGYLSQINIASIVNHLDQDLNVNAEYRDLTGELKRSINFKVPGKIKYDLIVNEVGLEEDSYGSLCINTDASIDGAWSGGITLYKQRFNPGEDFSFSESSKFDFALYYPFVNPHTGIRSASLNTFHIGTDGRGTIANWIRLTDGNPNNDLPLRGRLGFYDSLGNLLENVNVEIPNGGRFDFSGHTRLGTNAVGLAIFTPSSLSTEYFLETTRYFYEGEGATSSNFYTAFPIPDRPATIEKISGFLDLGNDLINVIETLNVNPAKGSFNYNFSNSAGANLLPNQKIELASRSNFHNIVTADKFNANQITDELVISEVFSEDSPTSAISVSYVFDASGKLLYGFAPPLIQSAGKSQVTEFNSFLGQQNQLFLYNSSDQELSPIITLFDEQGKVVDQFTRTLSAKTALRENLNISPDKYGIIIIDAGDNFGLVARNEVIKDNEFRLPFIGR